MMHPRFCPRPCSPRVALGPRLLVRAMLCALVWLSCTCAHTGQQAAPVAARAGTLAHIADDVWVYTSSPAGFETRSYILDGPEGLVVLDTQFLPSAAAELITWAEARLEKRVVAALVLHANPDKFNGTATFEARGIPVWTSADVARAIPEVHALRKRWFYKRYQPDYPARAAAPRMLRETQTTFTAGGLTLALERVKNATSAAHLIVTHGAHLFVGDLVASGAHAWTELGHVYSWSRTLTALSTRAHTEGLTWVHPGRGPSGSPRLLERQVRYLDTLRAHITRAQAAGHTFAHAKASLWAHMRRDYPSYTYPLFAKLGLRATWETVVSQGAFRESIE